MPQRVTITLSDEHYNWLEEVKKRRGWDKIQDTIRSLIEDSYRLDKKLGVTNIDHPVSLIKAEVVKEKGIVS